MITTYEVNKPELQTKLKVALSQFEEIKILIIGDCGIDEYIIGEVKRISPEAPVPVVEVHNEEYRLGLAANVALNVATLGGIPILFSLVGTDSAAERLKELLKQSKISDKHLFQSSLRPTTRKTRIMAGHHHVVRVDFESKSTIEDKILAEMIDEIDQIVPHVSGMILQDYGKGLISPILIRKLLAISQKHQKPIWVDPYRTHRVEFYAGVNLIKPNQDEALALIGVDESELQLSSDWKMIGESLLHRSRADHIVITRGSQGMLIFEKDNPIAYKVPTYAREVFDVTGAGDTVIAALGLGLSAGLSLPEACVLANHAAGIVVAKPGCVPCYRTELEKELVKEI